MKLLKDQPPKLSTREERLVNAMHALGDKSRFKIFMILLSGKEMCVSEIAATLDVSTPAVSQHFRIFELVGLVDKRRDGQKICYSIKANDPLVGELVDVVLPNNGKGEIL